MPTELLEGYSTEEIEEATQAVLKRHEIQQRYYQNTKEKLLQYQHQYYQDNKGEMLEQQRQYRQDNRDERLQYYHQHDKAHREEKLQYFRQHRKENIETFRNYKRKRRALEAGADGNFTAEEFRLLCEAYENRCVYCGEELPLVPDHATPLSRGGSNNIDNIVPACTSCNSAKGTKTFDEYIEYIVVYRPTHIMEKT